MKYADKRGRALMGAPIGFHGDFFLLTVVHHLLRRSSFFIETGSNVASTLAYVARTFPDIICYSCEPDSSAFNQASTNIESYKNVHLYQELSQDFLKRFLQDEDIKQSVVTFWLDAHDFGFEWPLKDEVELITTHFPNAFIFIDDFQVPDAPEFGYDSYNGQTCSFDYIHGAFCKGGHYVSYYPNYRERTSSHHGLRGWCLFHRPLDLGVFDRFPVEIDRFLTRNEFDT